MKHVRTLCLLGFSLFVTSCTQTRFETAALKETYLHKYGVPVTKEEWKKQGGDGHIVRYLRSGVTATFAYKDGELDGESTFTFPNSSTIERVETYDNGVLKSRRFHYSNGLAKAEEHYKDNLLSERRTWFEEGTPQAIETFSEGMLVNAQYRGENNEIESKIENGCGTRIHRNRNGEIAYKELFKGGYICERIDYHPTGEPAAITPYENNHIHGTRLTFFPGGLPCTAEEWRFGVQEGPTLVYDNGEVIAEVPYVHGQKQGIEKRFREGSELAEEIFWKNGKQHGPRTIHFDQETRTEWYHQGELVSRPTFERLNTPLRRS